MKYLAIIPLFLVIRPAFSQTIIEIDSVSNIICMELEKTREVKNDTLRYNNLVENQINQYLKTIDSKDVDRVWQSLYFRLQRNCLDFIEILDRLDPAKSYEIKRITVKPNSTISNKDLDIFKKTNNFFYYEVNGDTTIVSMSNGVWKDYFKDKTTSNLTYKWTSDTDFLLTFVKSDNELRKNFSVPGDKFLYSVISKGKNYYVLTAKIPTHNKYEEFKLYFK